jgi:hypothetical protein
MYRLRHEIAVRSESGVAIRAEVVLRAVELDVPQPAALAEERFRIVRHE